MTHALAQRLIALAGIALLAVLLALALKPSTSHKRHLPRSIPVPGGGWYVNLMDPHGTAFSVHKSCGFILSSSSLGLSSSLYPCRTKIWLHVNGEDVLTQVISKATPPPGATFEVSPALAARLDLRSTQEIKWRFAG